MRKHRQLIIGLLLGALIGSVAVGFGAPDKATEFEQRSAAIWKAYERTYNNSAITGHVAAGDATKVMTQQNRIIIDQNNEIIRLLQALNMKGQG